MSKEKLTKEQKKAAKAEKKAEKKAKGGNPDISAAVIQCVSALLCVGIIAFGASSITNKVNQSNLDLAGGTAASGSQQAGSDDVAADDSTGAVVDDGTATDVADDGTTDDSITYDVDDSTATVSGDTGSTTGGSSTTPAAQSSDKKTDTAKKSMTTADYLNIYNNATKKAASKKVAFTKTRSTVEKKYEAGLALSTFKSIVYKFMSIGEGNKYSKTIEAGDSDYATKFLLPSSLTTADITSATCKDNGNTYTITFGLKGGSSAVVNGQVTQHTKTSLDKCGISNGDNDKDYWDHKKAQNIFDAIDDIAGKATIKESYSNAVVTMIVGKDGNLQSLTAKFALHVDIDNVMASSGVADAESTVVMNNFKW